MSRSWALDYDTANCNIAAALAVVGEKWTFLVLREAFNGVRRFDDMQRRTGAPRQVLSNRLASLIDDGILRKAPYQEEGQRPRSEYRLTQKGIDLFPVIASLLAWGDKYTAWPGGPAVELTHRGCGAPVALRLTCSAGHELDSARDVTPVPGPGARRIA
jgi:DNA-binding HxlR family transcriptional regulator